ncbi:glycogen synthase GlgA [Paracidovorax oryzae]|uniref:glycogen synthase GlgA n=1 Tax=Paracidovorax oryzae TaxID=862720 RepID=UPI00047B61A8|nr:glycogen synthase GlgA [Paracidovorax oryzae]
MKILFATSECAPLVKTGGLGDVSAALPPAIAALGHEVVLLMPAYADMPLQGQITGWHSLPAEGPWPAAQLLRVDRGRNEVPLLLLSCPQLYARPGSPYAGAQGEHPDNALRFGLLAHVAARIGTPQSPCGWTADIVHANDWPTALAPLYLRQFRDAAGPRGDTVARSMVTVHNLAFQGVFPMDWAQRLGIEDRHLGIEGAEFWGQLSMLKAGLQYADAITTVSPTYAREIQTSELGFGLDGVLRARADRLQGILNGIDTALWNPSQDPQIPAHFSADRLEGKAACKAALRRRLGLAQDDDRMLFGLVGRMTEQKGIDWVIGGAERLLRQGGQLAILGSGDPALESALRALAKRHPRHMHVTVGFDESLAHAIEAGSDSFLMPSRFEPCGLNQMYSQAYGTPPVVTPTGGLADSVVDADDPAGNGTGFILRGSSQAAFDQAVGRALHLWKTAPDAWRHLQRNGMQRDFGWTASARTYLQAYGAARNRAETRPQTASALSYREPRPAAEY